MVLTVVISEQAGNVTSMAIIAVVISIAAFIFSIYWNVRSEKRGYLDTYWFREVTAPACVRPALELRTKWSAKIKSLANTTISLEDYRVLVKELDQEINLAVTSAWVSRLFKGDLYKRLRVQHEAALDAFTTRLGDYIQNGLQLTAERMVALEEEMSAAWLDILRIAAKANSSNLRI